MSNTPLPNQLDVRKLAVKGAEFNAETSSNMLPRVKDLLAGDAGLIKVDLRFYIDEERFRRIDGQISGEVEVICQRCMKPMPLKLDTDFSLGIVWSEEDAERLPKSLDPLIVGEELVDLADIVSEELILSLPFVNYHESADCQPVKASFGDETEPVEVVGDSGGEQDNPFKVLENLKFDK